METPESPAEGPGVREKFGRRLGIFRSLLSFLWKEKLWWMIPMIVVLGLLALLVGSVSMSGLAPFVYVLF
ncbi:MAG: hypothetical protein A3G34_01230 [Candidatus Lindowbacteria bacterium RIFCSPLOWO2_12_FULL_62_27]|nr:MAG: hypothetical protein A3G34_01230 [Candidatus Lindowbacteria bacterium RIFCSPLOWO2_12_FULL_62_27]OGH63693.1 MAG: hypothetical protein A3I06_07680 [Candidatus Lindowbacteria bacterium RIFCSPLOWO2_02_FULL_62_12]